MCWITWCQWSARCDPGLHTPEDLFLLRLEHLHQSHTPGEITAEIAWLDFRLDEVNHEPSPDAQSTNHFRELLVRIRSNWPT